ncbi:MAG: VWA domain-containing protein [Thermoanaerobacterales bacterium]
MPGGTAWRGAPEPGRDGGELLARVDLAEVVAAVGHLLHAAGVPVTPERSGRFARAVTLARPATLDELYWAGRVTLLGGADQVPVYDAVFGQVFRGRVDVADRRGQEPSGLAAAPRARPTPVDRAPTRAGATAGPPPAPRVMTPTGGSPGDEAVAEGADVLAAASPEERLGHTDLAALTDDELAALRPLLAALPWAAPRRPGRRTTRHRRGRRLDLRATLRSARRTGGDPVRRIARRRVDRPRRLVLLADVSGSMAPYARAWLHLLHGAVRAARADAFVFATRLTRLTRALATSDPDAALRRATAAAPDWSGGTRIGAALAAFVDRHGRRGVARGAVVVIVSDGWDTGDPAVVGEQMARLARLAHRIVWVNPRRAAPGYRPLVGGMAAALPHVDAFVSGHTAAALAEVVAAIGDPG